MKKSLIFCSVGQPLPSDGPYALNHWRRTDRGHREYETAIVNYNYESDFKPEEYSYDFIDNKYCKKIINPNIPIHLNRE